MSLRASLSAVSVFVLAIVSVSFASFETVGVYDPNDSPHFNQVDQSGEYASHTGDAGPSNVIDLAAFQELIGPAYDADAGGVVDVENGSMEGQDVVAKFGAGGFKSVTFTSTSGNLSRGSSIGSGNRYPISGSRRFSKGDTGDFVFDVGLVGGGAQGEIITYFAATLLYRDDRDMNPQVTATFSGGGTVTATADMVDGGPAMTKDTFFGFVAPPGQSIVNVNFDLASYTHMDDLAFITSEYITTPSTASKGFPAGGFVVDIKKAGTLKWQAGNTAASHDVYFSENFDDVNEGTLAAFRGNQADATYNPPAAELEMTKTYYWRVDEVEAGGIMKHTGPVWSFIIADFLSVDNFEDYNNYEPYRIFDKWLDGWGNEANGSLLGHPDPDFAQGGTFMEQGIVNEGSTQSMPYYYDNDGRHSEATLPLDGADRDWTRFGVKALSLWYIGYPGQLGSLVEAPAGTYTMTGAGTDIWNPSDEFHYAWKMMDGPGSITAKVESLEGEDLEVWAKVGVMFRESLEPDAAFAGLYYTGSNGVRYQARTTSGGSCGSDTSVTTLAHIRAPHWIRLERTFEGDFLAYDSNDGQTWYPLVWGAVRIQMPKNAYVGLAVTSHQKGVGATAVFSNVSFTGTVTGAQFTNQDIGITSNVAEPMYVEISSGATMAPVLNPDPNAALVTEWTAWHIPLTDFADVDLTDVEQLSIRFGAKGSTQPGGKGLVYFDDIGLYRPRCMPEILTLAADLNADCLVDEGDLQMMAADWLWYDKTSDGLLGHWRFDGNLNDSSSGAHHGDPNDDPLFATGQLGQALEFDGAGDYIEHDLVLPLKAGTIAHWLKPNELERMVAYYEGSESENGWSGGDNDVLEIHTGINGTDGRWYVCYQDGPGGGSTDTISGDSDVPAQAGVWTHVTVTWDRSDGLTLYADGVSIGGTSFSDDIFTSNKGRYHRIGAPSDTVGELGSARLWRGAIDDVRVYDRALTPDEIQSVMTGAALPEQYYPINSAANLSDEEAINSKKIDFKDFAVLAGSWLDNVFWPQQ